MMNLAKQQTQIKTMSSREIAELTGKEHRNVKRDCEVMFSELNLDALSFEHIYLDSMNRQQTEYLLTRELVQTLITGYNIKLRHAVIQRLNELEAQVSLTLPNFTDPAEAAIAWATEYKAKKVAIAQAAHLENQVNQLTPKAKALETLASGSQDLLCLTDAAKHLHINRNVLTNLLSNKKWIYRRKTSTQRKGAWTAYDSALRQGYLYHDYTEIEKPHGIDYSAQVLVTKKGMAHISQFLAEIEVTA